ncbi:FtsW/RodA/SpoVE family cell cycle protein [Anaerosacchariphilus polymeriproducens]|uniref:Rod shape-determining protein RodA n=1 Tax=Anaerosacchariphilus polymeriproducens TaxID=1812858 RepID=A0A371AU24_9FIRM|nr:FtsW/RodA/SpoVE family cell cycle protein [Anaerosacchariphilus polymeriproducens]RDU23058.1 rod shape-determining protein RodA [Anaerosacchariphilus polymeriproducens]
MLKQYKLKDYHFRLIILIMALSTIGVFVVGSALKAVQNKQLFGVILGLCVMIVISLIDYKYILNYYWILYFANIGFLLLVRFFGDDAGGATRWIDIGFRFQPSELSKILLIIFFAEFFNRHIDDLNTLKTLALTGILILIPWLLILKQPALSTSIVVALIFCVIIYIAGLSPKIIGCIFALFVPLAGIFISIILQPNQSLLQGYQFRRIMAWLHPENKLYLDLTLQQKNSIMAIGSGQLFGKGLNNTMISSVKNGDFVSESHTDFIFSVVGEELGFVGGCVVIGLLLLIVLECIWIGKNAKDKTGTMICCGMAALIAFQSFINISVVTRLLPNTGLVLPFVSYGLSSLISLFIGMGLVLNVGLQPKKY